MTWWPSDTSDEPNLTFKYVSIADLSLTCFSAYDYVTTAINSGVLNLKYIEAMARSPLYQQKVEMDGEATFAGQHRTLKDQLNLPYLACSSEPAKSFDVARSFSEFSR
ncbi:hypothetical protein PT974_03306 [Cladobotryum mycophilum]|uniref:Uncharacterized protein n=1 Tax=Cladobotryum mycophilum TaxID=491253 RepID=A0ABR0SRX6_9HYPO